ncbi:MAG TPA: protein translocase subunit SecD [Longimicrobiaceae bacterium]|jgi:preprotein translocase subunit SecD|nr:protein translocase subunit SecD [Longimicrobiaceae bacterium]
MFQNLKVRIALILVVMAGSAWFLYSKRPKLGLDLQGGIHLALEIDKSRATSMPADALDRALQVVHMRVDGMGVSEPVVQKAGNDRIIVELAGDSVNTQAAKEVIQKTAFLQFQIVRPLTELQTVLPRIDRAVAEAKGTLAPVPGAKPAAAAPASPVGGLFQAKPDSAKAGTDSAKTGTDSAKANAATVTDTAGTGSPFTKLLAGGPVGQLLVDSAKVDEVKRYLALPQVQAVLPRGTEVLWGYKGTEEQAHTASLWLVSSVPMMTGDKLENAQAETDQFQRPIVTFELSSLGGHQFEKATGAHVGEQMAIVLDDQVYTAPRINSEIGKRGQIELGKATIEDATNLALVLRAGALPAPLRIVEERSVGASLGSDSVHSGIWAGIVGIGLVVLMMIGIYHFSGVLACIALAGYCLLVMGGMSMIEATLTFPGIAGLILSVGTAVDANVLIFERIREELDHGRNVRTAVSEGFTHALRAIIDSSVTTLITCAILFYTGTGPIRGFAVTLTVGVVASLFTAVFVTRTLFIIYLERRATAQSISI